jgi:hypothetical protein
MAGAAAPTPPQPSMMSLAGMQSGQQMGQAMTPGMSQVSESAVRMSAEIDQALKLLAQAIPQLAPWVEQVTNELRNQVGQALQGGAVPTDPSAQDNSRFPDGAARL